MADDLAYMTIRELGGHIRRGAVSVEQLVRAALERADRIDHRLNSFITVAADSALTAAKALDGELRRGTSRGALHGIPVTIKDHVDTAGIPTTAGSTILKDRVPAVDAPVVRQLKAAGAVVIGKANLNQFAGGESGWNPDYGKIRNPRALEYSVGGSSGGSAAQVAAGIVPLSIGSDNGGSIRIPAALCGIVGMKPTFGRVSIDGVAPRSYSSDHVGPLARTVDDAAIAMEAISGHVAGSSTTFHRAVPAYSLEARGGVRGLRIGVDRKYCERGQPAVLEAFRNALTTLEGLGCFVRDISFPTFTDVLDLTNLIFQPEVSLWYETFIAQHASEVTPALRSGARTAEVISACDYLRAGQRRRQMQVAVAQQMREVDVLALPTYFLALRPFPASSDMALGGYPKIGDYEPTGTDGIYYTLPFNLLGLPAVSVPCRIGDDGCVGLQIVGKAWDETTVLRAARAYEEAAGWTHVAPPVL